MSWITSGDIWRITASSAAARLSAATKYNPVPVENETLQAQQHKALTFRTESHAPVTDAKPQDLAADATQENVVSTTAPDVESVAHSPHSNADSSANQFTSESTVCAVDHAIRNACFGSSIISGVIRTEEPAINWLEGEGCIQFGVLPDKGEHDALLPPVARYEGQFRRSRLTGLGTIVWQDGSSFTGQVKDGLREGFGLMLHADGERHYCGQWLQGRRSGRGRLCYNAAGSSVYQGSWKDNHKHGWGVQQYEGGYYKGQWLNGKRHGYGIYSLIDRSAQYTGDWRNGMPHGWGLQIWNDCSMGTGCDSGDELLSYQVQQNRYEGQFECGQRNGYGVFWYANGCRYEGQWLLNRKHGPAIFTTDTGHCYKCIYDNDKLISSSAYRAASGADLGALIWSAGDELGGGQAACEILFQDQEQTVTNLDLVLELEISRRAAFPRRDRLSANGAYGAAQIDAQKSINAAQKWLIRNLRILRRMYSLYRKLAAFEGQDPSTLSFLQFWILAADAHVFNVDWSLSKINRVLHAATETDSVFEKDGGTGERGGSNPLLPISIAKQCALGRGNGDTSQMENLPLTENKEQSTHSAEAAGQAVETAEMQGVPPAQAEASELLKTTTLQDYPKYLCKDAYDQDLPQSSKTGGDESSPELPASESNRPSNVFLEKAPNSPNVVRITDMPENRDSIRARHDPVPCSVSDNNGAQELNEAVSRTDLRYTVCKGNSPFTCNRSCLPEREILLFPSFLRALVLMAQQQSIELSKHARPLEYWLGKFIALLLQFYETCNATSSTTGSRKSSNVCGVGKRASRRSSLSQKMRCPSAYSSRTLSMFVTLTNQEIVMAFSPLQPVLCTLFRCSCGRDVSRGVTSLTMADTLRKTNDDEGLGITNTAELAECSSLQSPLHTAGIVSKGADPQRSDKNLPISGKEGTAGKQIPTLTDMASQAQQSGEDICEQELLCPPPMPAGGRSCPEDSQSDCTHSAALLGSKIDERHLAPQIIVDSPSGPFRSSAVCFCHQDALAQITSNVVEEFNNLPLGLSPLEVVYILLNLIPEFHGQEEAMQILYDKGRTSTTTDVLLQTPAQEAQEEASASSSSLRSLVGKRCSPDESGTFPTAARDHPATDSQGQHCRRNSVNSGRLPGEPVKSSQRRDTTGCGRRRSRIRNERGKEHARVRITIGGYGRNDPSQSAEEADASVSTLYATADTGGHDPSGGQTGTPVIRAQQQQWQHVDSTASVDKVLASRPFADAYMQKCYRRLLRKILGQRKSSWTELANRDVTAFELKWILLQMVEYKTPGALGAHLPLPARVSLLVNRLLKYEVPTIPAKMEALNRMSSGVGHADSSQHFSEKCTNDVEDPDASNSEMPPLHPNDFSRVSETARIEHRSADTSAYFWEGFHTSDANGNALYADARLRFLSLDDDKEEETDTADGHEPAELNEDDADDISDGGAGDTPVEAGERLSPYDSTAVSSVR